jgi:chromosome segregation ATPase
MSNDDLDRLEQTVGRMQGELDRLEQTVGRVHGELDRLRLRMNDVQQNEVPHISERLTQLERKASRVEDKLERHIERLIQLEQKASRVEDKLERHITWHLTAATTPEAEA